MRYFDVSQRSPEWYAVRIGVATASCFDKIMTPAKRQFSKSADDYAHQLIAEMFTGKNLEKFKPTYWMEHGTQYEMDAMKLYALETGYTLDRGGFMTNDEVTVGCSPDVRVLDSAGRVIGAAEIKCPAPDTHVANLLRDEIDPDYLLQVQGQIMVGDFGFVDWYSYNPDMPPKLIRTYPDEEVIADMRTNLEKFEDLLAKKIAHLETSGLVIKRTAERIQEIMPAPGATLEDFLAAG